MAIVYLGLGSNLGDRYANLRQAIDLLDREGIRTLRRSSVFETAPQEVLDQPWFLNLVLETSVRFFPRQLLQRTQRIELEMGRKKVLPKGPRLIDIDILVYGRATINLEGLTIPHKGMANRRFVLEPLAELVPQLQHPVLGATILELLENVRNQVVRLAGRQDF
jgi:2-amino-4-hydroxy-6-hydroxymethyldihydropteridine diphosphokinase